MSWLAGKHTRSCADTGRAALHPLTSWLAGKHTRSCADRRQAGPPSIHSLGEQHDEQAQPHHQFGIKWEAERVSEQEADQHTAGWGWQ